MGWYGEQVLPRIVDLTCGTRRIGELRADAVDGMAGTVLEVGFGSGLNLPHLPDGVDRVVAVEPSDTAWRMADDRVGDATATVERVGLDGEELPLADASADAALTTFTLCTIPDVGRALREIRRVLKPGGHLYFLEHGLAPDARVAAWQHRLTPIQRRIAGGCHLDRPIDELVASVGFEIDDLHTGYEMPGPKAFGYLFRGVAHAA